MLYDRRGELSPDYTIPDPRIQEVPGLRAAKREVTITPAASIPAPAIPAERPPVPPPRPDPIRFGLNEDGTTDPRDPSPERHLAQYREALDRYEEDMGFFNARDELARGVSPVRDPPPVPIPPEPYQRMSESERNQLLNEGLSEGEIERLEHASLLRYLRAERDYAEELGLGNAPRTARRTVRLAQASSDAGRTPTHVSEPSVPPASSRGVPSSPDGSPPGSSNGGDGGGGGGSSGRGVAGHHRRLEETVRNTTIAKRPAGGGESTYKYQQTRTLKSDHPIPMP